MPLPTGSLRVADLGFYDLDVLTALDTAGVYWLSRIQTNSRIALPGQREQSLVVLLDTLGTTSTWESPVMVGKGGRVAARLLVERVPQEVADERRRRIRAEAKDKGRMPAKAALTLADWNILITHVPPALLTIDEAMVLMRVRWQIELFFKLWKSQGVVDEWRTKKPARILCEVYAKLVALLVQHWILLATAWAHPERSLVKAAHIVRSYAYELASAHGHHDRVLQVLTTMGRVIQRMARMNQRKKAPSTAQRLLAVTSTLT